jgi:hypothetical protein
MLIAGYNPMHPPSSGMCADQPVATKLNAGAPIELDDYGHAVTTGRRIRVLVIRLADATHVWLLT